MNDNNNVTTFRRPSPRTLTKTSRDNLIERAYTELTTALVMERARRGQLDPGIVAALLMGVGLEPPQ